MYFLQIPVKLPLAQSVTGDNVSLSLVFSIVVHPLTKLHTIKLWSFPLYRTDIICKASKIVQT